MGNHKADDWDAVMPPLAKEKKRKRKVKKGDPYATIQTPEA